MGIRHDQSDLANAHEWHPAEVLVLAVGRRVLGTGVNAAILINASRVDLADSTLHAPQAGSDDTDFYPDLHDKAAALACRIAWNHPLPDGNKRAAWACLVMFIDLNDGSWNDERPDTDDAVEAMLAVAAHDIDETWLASWLKNRVEFRT